MNKNEYNDFCRDKSYNSPSELDKKIIGQVHQELTPNESKLFVKILLVQAFTSTLTLLFCPQFKLSLTHYDDLFHFIHHNFGHYPCMFICGTIFIGSGALFARTIISKPELSLLKRRSLLYYTTFSGVSILLFLFLGAELYLDATIIWFLGATLSGMTITALPFFRVKEST